MRLYNSYLKKSLALTLLVVFVFGLSTSFAWTEELDFPYGDNFSERSHIIDEDGVLSASEKLILEDKINKLYKNRNIEVVLYATKTLDLDESAEEEAIRSQFKYSKYGSDTNQNGAVFYVNFKTRQFRISYFGVFENIYNSAKREIVLGKIKKHLKNNDTFKGMKAFLADIDMTAESASDEDGNYSDKYDVIYPPIDNENKTFMQRLQAEFREKLYFIFAGLIAGGFFIFVYSRHKGVDKVNPTTYEDTSSFYLSRNIDDFKYSRTSRSARPKASSSSGGGGGGSSSGSSF